ncbi:hypothetical protein Bxe_A2576 [Paraburkholderia xenovorans LB400]|uniref:Uncharacterized protein n=1 Tax=Paraburkholderia xenovorans (strain LB400) TaxID=266265 RepID=Q13ZT6_PARXL|nr:hypothetical protein Bxe_A2576 [Paraburkholderia xenovorans LB400]
MRLPTPTAPSPISGIQMSDVDRTTTQESVRPVHWVDQSTSRTRATRYAVAQGRSADSLGASYERRSLAHGNFQRTSPKAFSQQIKNEVKTRDGRIGYRRFWAPDHPAIAYILIASQTCEGLLRLCRNTECLVRLRRVGFHPSLFRMVIGMRQILILLTSSVVAQRCNF